MPQARGTQTTVALYEETTYGADPGTPSGILFYNNSASIQASQGLLNSNTLGGSRARSRPARGNINVGGPLTTEISAENIGLILKHAMGSVQTTGAGPYTHTFTLGDLPVGLVVELDYGANISGTGRYAKNNGMRVGSMKLNFPTEGYCTATFDMKGASNSLASAPLDASLTNNGHTPFSSFNATIQEGGGAIATVTNVEINLDNETDDSVFVIGGAGVRRALPEGFSTVSGTLTALFEDATLLNKAINDTQTSLQITLQRGTGLGSSGNEYVQFLVQNMVYERTTPAIEGPRGLLVKLPFTAYRVTTDNGLQAIVRNTIATI